jgi:hypothetical protein
MSVKPGAAFPSDWLRNAGTRWAGIAHFVWISLLLLQLTVQTSQAETEKTVIRDQNQKRMLLGVHRLSLQWISWEKFGKVKVTESGGTLFVKGEQRGPSYADDPRMQASQPEGEDYLKIDGIVTELGSKQFKFHGKIVTRVAHINGGKECKRNGNFTFAKRDHPGYWRMQEIDNPCDEAADYVDIYVH